MPPDKNYTIGYMISYSNVHSKADISQLNLSHETKKLKSGIKIIKNKNGISLQTTKAI